MINSSIFLFVDGNPLRYTDPLGLFGYAEHQWITNQALGENTQCADLAKLVAGVDFLDQSQDPAHSFWHAMSDGRNGQSAAEAEALYNNYINDNIASGTIDGFARALHAAQDSVASGHRGFKSWAGEAPSPGHMRGDVLPSKRSLHEAIQKSKDILGRSSVCGCQ